MWVQLLLLLCIVPLPAALLDYLLVCMPCGCVMCAQPCFAQPLHGTAKDGASQLPLLHPTIMNLLPNLPMTHSLPLNPCAPPIPSVSQVMWFQGLIVLVVILLALCVGCSCMHLIDVPTRFPQAGEASRTHKD
jgi:hypothetical protein